MPKSKRSKLVSLTKVKKKTRENKDNLVGQVREAVEKYQNVFVYNIDAMRSSSLIDVRQKFKANSRFFYGKNNLIAVALGRDAASEKAEGIHNISNMLTGQCGLLFTNEPKADIIKFFKSYAPVDYARAGQTVDEDVVLNEGPLEQFSFAIEPQLRKLGLPTKLENGIIKLIEDFTVCSSGDKLTPEQAKILKLLDMKLSTFRLHLLALWSTDDGFKRLVAK